MGQQDEKNPARTHMGSALTYNLKVVQSDKRHQNVVDLAFHTHFQIIVVSSSQLYLLRFRRCGTSAIAIVTSLYAMGLFRGNCCLVGRSDKDMLFLLLFTVRTCCG